MCPFILEQKYPKITVIVSMLLVFPFISCPFGTSTDKAFFFSSSGYYLRFMYCHGDAGRFECLRI